MPSPLPVGGGGVVHGPRVKGATHEVVNTGVEEVGERHIVLLGEAASAVDLAGQCLPSQPDLVGERGLCHVPRIEQVEHDLCCLVFLCL